MLKILFLILGLGCLVGSQLLFQRLRMYRKDRPKDMPDELVESISSLGARALDRHSYTEDGMRVLTWLYILLLTAVTLLAGAVVIWSR